MASGALERQLAMMRAQSIGVDVPLMLSLLRDGAALDSGQLQPAPQQSQPQPLAIAPPRHATEILTGAALKEHLVERVKEEAEAARMRHITAGAGKQAAYAEKVDEAIRLISRMNAARDPASEAGAVEKDRHLYPVLSASVPIEAETLVDAASLVLQKYDAWRHLLRDVEAVEIAAKHAIRSAASDDLARAAFNDARFP